MQEPYWWYVLYVRTNTEHRVVTDFNNYYIQNFSSQYELELFCPESEYYFRNSKNRQLGKKYLKRPLFPNYVFIETNMPTLTFLKEFAQYIYNSADIIRILRYGDSPEIALTFEERRRFEYLFKGTRCLEHSEGYMEGDVVKIVAGPLIGLEGIIKKINRHNCNAVIEIDMFNQKQTIKVALEIVSKLNNQDE
jgi:transcriptional antiterminator NusG